MPLVTNRGASTGLGAELKHIMCVDDESDILEVARMCLEIVGGFRVTCSVGGAAALADATRDRPDLILLDVMMPDMNGSETLRLLRTIPQLQSIPVIFMTARVQRPEIASYLKLGAAGFIAKPFEPMVLPGQVRDIWAACRG